MKKLALILTITILVSFVLPAHAADDASVQSVRAVQGALSSGDVHVSVNGLVCDFCARALEKVFGKEEAVKGIGVNLDTKIITINFKEGQSLDDERITKLIKDAGYNVEDIHHVQ